MIRVYSILYSFLYAIHVYFILFLLLYIYINYLYII